MSMKITTNPLILLLFISFFAARISAQPGKKIMVRENDPGSDSTGRIIEIRGYNLVHGSREQFEKLFLERSLPLLKKFNVEVVTFGPSLYDEDSYFLVRSYRNLREMKQSEDAFYGSDDWRKGPREAILALITNYTTIVLPDQPVHDLTEKLINMEKELITKKDSEQLSALNAQFIKNFLTQDASSHNEIIYKDFFCIEGDGTIVDRDTYMKNWASDFTRSGYKSFSYSNESIRIFGNFALVRARTNYTKVVDGQTVSGHSIYTDTYIKENGRWWCVQAHITPVKVKLPDKRSS
jgi:hypothetical protein